MDVKVICSFILGATVLAMYFCLRLISYQVIEESQDVLVCKLRPTISWAIATLCGGLIILFTFAGLTYPHINFLKCSHIFNERAARLETNCKLIKIGWQGEEVETTLIPKVKAAILETKLSKYGRDGSLNRYRVSLTDDEDSFPLKETYEYKLTSDHPKFFNYVEEINAFIDNPLADNLSLQQDDSDLVYVGIGMIIFTVLVAASILAFSPYITFTCDRQSNMATLARHNLFRHKVSIYQISDIASVEVQETSDIESTQYRVIIVLQSGEKVPFTYWFTSGWQEKYSIAHKIQKFLQLKPQMDKS